MSSPTYTKQEQEPASEEVTEVANGVLRMQLPISLPGLGHVNCYALVDGDGVALVDPGLPGEESWNALMARLRQAEIPVERVHT
ncbi:MAG: MBL fold metallo-hydrolase, partial [Actinomycetota bacterium]